MLVEKASLKPACALYTITLATLQERSAFSSMDNMQTDYSVQSVGRQRKRDILTGKSEPALQISFLFPLFPHFNINNRRHFFMLCPSQ